MKLNSRPPERKLYPFQEEALYYALEIKNPALLLQMRLGKSLCAIRWVKALKTAYPLVVAPLQAMEGWQRELFKEREQFITAVDMPAAHRGQAIAQARRSRNRIWVLINYEGLLAVAEKRKYNTKKLDEDGEPIQSIEYEMPEIALIPWDNVILDESPKIKTPGTVISEICTRGFRSAKHRAILTGAIKTENHFEVFQQYLFLDGHFMGFKNFYTFQKTFFYKVGYKWEPKPGAERKIQEYVHKRSFIRKRSDVGLGEKKIYERRYVNMSTKQKKLYKAIEDEFTAYLLNGGSWETEYALVRRNWLAKLAGGFDAENSLVCGAKADDIIELLRGELSGEKMCIWFRYRHELSYVAERLTKAKILNSWIMSGISVSQRKERLQYFRTRGRALLATEDCLKYGVDASVADISYYYSNSDSGDSRIQSEDRIVQPYTKDLGKSLLLIDSITRNSIDEMIVDNIHYKTHRSRLFHMDPKKRFLLRMNL